MYVFNVGRVACECWEFLGQQNPDAKTKMSVYMSHL